jgi:hypothetical protein
MLATAERRQPRGECRRIELAVRLASTAAVSTGDGARSTRTDLVGPVLLDGVLDAAEPPPAFDPFTVLHLVRAV